MFHRTHHKFIALILKALNTELFKKYECYFGGGTAIVLTHNEYRESIDVDFLISNTEGYRELRQLVKKEGGLKNIFKSPVPEIIQFENLKIDQYGIRSFLMVLDQKIKFEIIHEGRIQFELPKRQDKVCQVSALSVLDLATSKILANSDRWADEGVFSRDIIDLAMMNLNKKTFERALQKAEQAYGDSAKKDLQKAIINLKQRPEYLARCCEVLSINESLAEIWQKVRRIERWV